MYETVYFVGISKKEEKDTRLKNNCIYYSI